MPNKKPEQPKAAAKTTPAAHKPAQGKPAGKPAAKPAAKPAGKKSK